MNNPSMDINYHMLLSKPQQRMAYQATRISRSPSPRQTQQPVYRQMCLLEIAWMLVALMALRISLMEHLLITLTRPQLLLR